jgi:hypothetical protein
VLDGEGCVAPARVSVGFPAFVTVVAGAAWFDRQPARPDKPASSIPINNPPPKKLSLFISFFLHHPYFYIELFQGSQVNQHGPIITSLKGRL